MFTNVRDCYYTVVTPQLLRQRNIIIASLTFLQVVGRSACPIKKGESGACSFQNVIP